MTHEYEDVHPILEEKERKYEAMMAEYEVKNKRKSELIDNPDLAEDEQAELTDELWFILSNIYILTWLDIIHSVYLDVLSDFWRVTSLTFF